MNDFSRVGVYTYPHPLLCCSVTAIGNNGSEPANLTVAGERESGHVVFLSSKMNEHNQQVVYHTMLHSWVDRHASISIEVPGRV